MKILDISKLFQNIDKNKILKNKIFWLFLVFIFVLLVLIFLLGKIFLQQKPIVITKAGALEKEIVCNSASFDKEFADFVYSTPLKVPDFWKTELQEKGVSVPIHMYRIKATVNKMWEGGGQLMWELIAGNNSIIVEVSRVPPKLNALAYKWSGDPKDNVKIGDRVNVLLGAICDSETEPKLEFYDYKIFQEK